MKTALTVLLWIACVWMAASLIASGVAIYLHLRDRKKNP